MAVRARRSRGRGAVLRVGPWRAGPRCRARAVGRRRRVAGGDVLRGARRVRPRRRADGGGPVRGLGRRVRHRRGGAPRGRRPRRADRSWSSRAGSTGPIRRGTRDCSRRSWGRGGRSCRRCPGQPADQEPVPAAEPADRRGRSGHGGGRGGVALGRDEHGSPCGAAPATRRCRAGPGDVDGLRRLPPAAAGGRRGVRHGCRRGA